MKKDLRDSGSKESSGLPEYPGRDPRGPACDESSEFETGRMLAYLTVCLGILLFG